jgi:hypothetical protein
MQSFAARKLGASRLWSSIFSRRRFLQSLTLLTFTASARADEVDTAQIKSAVGFSLQCNATLGTIEDVEITAASPGPDGTVTVRGTYRQKVGSFGRFGFQAPEATGGVFEGIYQRSNRSLKALQFKISIRSGNVPASCLR